MKLNLGCGAQVVETWINVDYSLGARLAKVPLFGALNRRLRLFNLDWDSRIALHDLTKPLPWTDGSCDAIYSSHTLEHLTRDDGRRLLAECHRVLRPGGILRIVVPDVKAIVDRYSSGDVPADSLLDELGVLYEKSGSRLKNSLSPFIQYPHKCMYDAPTLKKVMDAVGFASKARAPLDSEIADIDAIELPGRTIDAVVMEGVKG